MGPIPGQRYDHAIGLYFYNARYYDPAIGRFIQPDTIVPNPGDPQSLNRYSYVGNNPVRYTDPSGHWGESFLDIAFIAYDIYDIKANGWNWVNGLSLAADVGGLVLPVVTGGGLLVRGAFHADDVAKVASHADEAEDALRLAGHLGDGTHAVLTASKLKQVGVHSDEGARLVKALAEQSTHGSGSRVVLGKWIKGGGYIAEAETHGGIYFNTAEGVWDALGKDPDLMWEVNEQFLRNQMEGGTGRIELVGESVSEVLKKRPDSFTAKEIHFLMQHAWEYGYELQGSIWIKVK